MSGGFFITIILYRAYQPHAKNPDYTMLLDSYIH
jgi:hypothetical protein